MLNDGFNDWDRVCLSKQMYQNLVLDQTILVANQPLGMIRQYLHTDDGFQAFVIVDRWLKPREVTVLFRGSAGIRRGNSQTWRNEWLGVNLPILSQFIMGRQHLPHQLRTAAQSLNRLCKTYSSAHFYLYGHSLGAINLQYALANCRHLGKIRRAYLYEGPNMYHFLSLRERRHVRRFKHKTTNYVDPYDPVTFGYWNNYQLVGRLFLVASKRMAPIHQHMWGGYRFDTQGRLIQRSMDDEFIRQACLEQAFIARVRMLAGRVKS